jgi:hypothetical protein
LKPVLKRGGGFPAEGFDLGRVEGEPLIVARPVLDKIDLFFGPASGTRKDSVRNEFVIK